MDCRDEEETMPPRWDRYLSMVMMIDGYNDGDDDNSRNSDDDRNGDDDENDDMIMMMTMMMIMMICILLILLTDPLHAVIAIHIGHVVAEETMKH